MKYNIKKEFKKYSFIKIPTKTFLLTIINLLMPIILRGKKIDNSLLVRKVEFLDFKALLIKPKTNSKIPIFVYYHGGGFIMKASAHHKNWAQVYAKSLNCAILLVDYRLAPKNKFPTAILDCFKAYKWALEQDDFSNIAIGGNSAGGNLSIAVVQMIKKYNLKMPNAQLLIYPLVSTKMCTDSMRDYSHVPLWNNRLNRKAIDLYVDETEQNNILVSPLDAEDLSFLPPTYIEVAEFDCLHDEGVLFAQKLRLEGVDVVLNETFGTIHGYDIEEKSVFVKEQISKRIMFLKKKLF